LPSSPDTAAPSSSSRCDSGTPGLPLVGGTVVTILIIVFVSIIEVVVALAIAHGGLCDLVVLVGVVFCVALSALRRTVGIGLNRIQTLTIHRANVSTTSHGYTHQQLFTAVEMRTSPSASPTAWNVS
jgi:hypothetical protein